MNRYDLNNEADRRAYDEALQQRIRESGLSPEEFDARLREVMPMVDALVGALQAAGCEPPDVITAGPHGAFEVTGKNWKLTRKKAW